MFYISCPIFMPMKLFVSYVGDLAAIGGSVLVLTSFRLLPGSFSFCLRGLGTSKFFYSGDLLTLWPSWVPERSWCEQDGKSRMLAIWMHTWWERKCIASLLSSVYNLLFVLIWHPGLATHLPQNRIVFGFW